MTDKEKIQSIQEVLGVVADGKFGPKSRAALEVLILSAQVQPVAAPAPDAENPVDARSEANIRTLNPKVQPLARALIRDATANGIKIVVTSGTRTYAEQDALFEQGRTKPGQIVTNARAGYSNHNFGVAFDVTIFDGAQPVWESPKYKTVGKLGKSLGLTWGGDWQSISDEPHFELHPAWADGESESSMLAELRKRHGSGQDAFA